MSQAENVQPKSDFVTANPRFVFIDALRGVAACAVLYHHLLHNSVLEVTLRKILPVPLQILSDYGSTGVQVFFVLSGFVITHSLRNMDGSFSAVKNFILRRQVRLDPVLWVVMLLTLAEDRVRLAIPSLHAEPLPTGLDVIKNIFYLQNILHVPQVVGVAWTLCIEVQFYLLFIVLMSIGIDRRSVGLKSVSRLSALLVGGLGIGAVCYSVFVSDTGPYCIAYWHYFAAGALCYWSLQKRIPQWMFLSFAAFFAALSLMHLTQQEVVGLSAVLLIYTVGRFGRLGEWLNQKPLQYLGRISYSLYLIHLLVAVSVLRFGYKLTHTNQIMSLFWLIVAAALSVGAAHLLYLFVERPSLKLTERLKLPIKRLNTASASVPERQAALKL